jgi:hypothetical protein
MPRDPISVRWTDDALAKAQQIGFTRANIEAVLRDGHQDRRRNDGDAQWRLTVGRLIIAYEYPDEDDPLVARTVTVWRRR